MLPRFVNAGAWPGDASKAATKSARASSRYLQAHARDAALVEQKGSFLAVELFARQQLGKRCVGARKVAAIESLQRASKSSFVPKHAPSMFTIDLVTLFPEIFAPFVGLSIVGRAVEGGIAEVRYHHLLDELAEGERADDAPYGGGPGMVLRIEPIARVLDRIAKEAPAGRTTGDRRAEPKRATLHGA